MLDGFGFFPLQPPASSLFVGPETPQNRPQYHRLRRIIAMVRDGMAGGRLPNRSDFRRELEAWGRLET